MGKQELRNTLEKRYASDKTICISSEEYKKNKVEVVVVDLLTRLYSVGQSDNAFFRSSGTIGTSLARDSTVLMTQLAEHFDWCFQKGARVVVCSLDKSAHVPITKGVEQRRRLDDSEANIADLDHEDATVAAAAREMLEKRAVVKPWMDEKMRKSAKAIANKLESYRRRCEQLADTEGRLTILALDDMRACWARLPEALRRTMLLQMRDARMHVRALDREQNVVCNALDDVQIEKIVRGDSSLDDYQLEAVLMNAVRSQALPEPWELMIRSNASQHGARAKITRYIIRALMHGYYEAYTPQLGTRLYIDGHNMPRWQIAQQNTFTRQTDQGDKLAVTAETFCDTKQKLSTKTRVVPADYDDSVPLELTNPADTRMYHKPDHTTRADSAGTLRVQQNVMPLGGINVMRRGHAPNAMQPRVRYAREYQNKAGEADMAVFTWIDMLRKRNALHVSDADPAADLEKYSTFEIVSTDSDLFYYTLLYLYQIRRAGDYEPQITLTMGSKWRPTDRVFNMNRMYRAVVDDMLGGDEDRIVSLMYTLYASAGDYIVGYAHVTPSSFIKAFCEGLGDAEESDGALVHLRVCDQESTGAFRSISNTFPIVSGLAYRQLLMGAYFQAHIRTMTGTLGHASVAEFRDLAQMRSRVNKHIVSPKYRKSFFPNKDSSKPLCRIPEYKAATAEDTDAARERASREADDLLELLARNIKKKIPTDEEIERRGKLLQYFATMSWQLGAREIALPDPLAFGYQLVDPDKPLKRRNIEFDAAMDYELLDFLADAMELEEGSM